MLGMFCGWYGHLFSEITSIDIFNYQETMVMNYYPYRLMVERDGLINYGDGSFVSDGTRQLDLCDIIVGALYTSVLNIMVDAISIYWDDEYEVNNFDYTNTGTGIRGVLSDSGEQEHGWILCTTYAMNDIVYQDNNKLDDLLKKCL